MSNTLLPVKLTRQRAISCLPLENTFSDNKEEENNNIWINYTEEMIREMLEKIQVIMKE